MTVQSQISWRHSPYLRLMRLHQPTGIWLLLWPCWWAVTLASPHPLHWRLLALFAAGAVVMRGAGCVFNDVVDQKFDALVARTRFRPLPAGDVTTPHALGFMVALLGLGLLILLQFNGFTIALGALALALVATYPFMKRITWWPQTFLGLTFNWGALMGFAAVDGALPPAAWALYVGGVFWTLGYDTIYALQDREDDILAGVKSTALHLRRHLKAWLSVFYGFATAGFALAGALMDLNGAYYVGVAVTAFHFAWQIVTLRPEAPPNALYRFRANRYTGAIIFVAMLTGRVISG